MAVGPEVTGPAGFLQPHLVVRREALHLRAHVDLAQRVHGWRRVRGRVCVLRAWGGGYGRQHGDAISFAMSQKSIV